MIEFRAGVAAAPGRDLLRPTPGEDIPRLPALRPEPRVLAWRVARAVWLARAGDRDRPLAAAGRDFLDRPGHVLGCGRAEIHGPAEPLRFAPGIGDQLAAIASRHEAVADAVAVIGRHEESRLRDRAPLPFRENGERRGYRGENSGERKHANRATHG